MAAAFDPAPFDVRSDPSADAWRVVAEGEIDIEAAPQLRAALTVAVGGDVPAVVLDLSQVTFIDSSGIGVLVEAAQRADAGGRRLTIITSPAVDRVIGITGLRERLPLA